jgi:hypothetical protein
MKLRTPINVFSVRFLPVAALLALMVTVSPASADVLYDVNFAATFGPLQSHLQFTEPSILSALTTVSSFSLETGDPISSLVLSPSPGGATCSAPGIQVANPCVVFSFANGDLVGLVGLSPFNSLGTISLNQGPITFSLTISPITGVPEPSSFACLGTVVAAVVVAFRRRRTGGRRHDAAV